MVKSSAYPGLDRKKPDPSNWVDQVGGLPTYIERIAKHLHYERGFTISHAIATAVNTVKRWARKGGVVKHGDPHNMHVTGLTAAQAAAAVAEWESKKAMARALPGTPRGGRMGRRRSVSLAEETLSIQALAERANAITDPARKARARERVLELAVFSAGQRRKLAGTGTAMPGGSFPIRNESDLRNAIRAIGRAKDPAAARRHIISRARSLGLSALIPKSWTSTDLAVTGWSLGGDHLTLNLAMTKDGRKSFKGVGKHKPPYQFRHGFVPITSPAVNSKAKGSPIARKRIERLFGAPNKEGNSTQTPSGPRSIANKPGWKPPQTVTARSAGSKGSSVTARNASQLRGVRETKSAQARPGAQTTRTSAVGGGGEGPSRSSMAHRPWGSIPDNRKTIRNGKKYVLTKFGGMTQLVLWSGPGSSQGPVPGHNLQVSVDRRKAQSMTKTELRKSLKAGTRKPARKTLNEELRKKDKRNRGRR